MAVSEEEIIRCRLLFDGEGTGDDRRIQTLLKTIVKWCHSDCSREESNLTYQKIIALLNQCEYSMVKNHLVYEMNTIERKNYEVHLLTYIQLPPVLYRSPDFVIFNNLSLDIGTLGYCTLGPDCKFHSFFIER